MRQFKELKPTCFILNDTQMTQIVVTKSFLNFLTFSQHHTPLFVLLMSVLITQTGYLKKTELASNKSLKVI